MENKICPNCGQTLLYMHSVIDDSDIKYEVLCAWCNYKSKLYSNRQEAKENYENAVLRL